MKCVPLSAVAFASSAAAFLPGSYGPQSEQFSAHGRLLGNSFGLPSRNATYDFVIAGAGLAGSVVAARLAHAFPNMTVAVVEAGSFYEISNTNYSQIPYYSTKFVSGDPDDWQPLIDWGLVSVPQVGANNRRIHYAQGKNLGGSSGRNQLIYHRWENSPGLYAVLDRTDWRIISGTRGSYQAWAEQVGDQSYTWDNMWPFFKKSFHFQAFNPLNYAANVSLNYSLAAYDYPGGPVAVSFPNYIQPISPYAVPAFVAAGLPPAQDFVSGSLMGYGYHEFTIDAASGTRSSSDQFLKQAIRETSLKIYAMSQVKNIVFDSQNRATGLNVTTMGLKPFTLTARKEVIISAGVWHSPQLLMVSGIGPRETLERYNIPVRSDLPGVGQNVWDTTNAGGPVYEVNVPAANPVVSIPELFEAATKQYFHNGTGPLSSEGNDFWGWEKIPAHLRANWSQATKDAFARFPADWPELELVWDASGGNLVETSSTKNYATLGLSLVATTSRGNMTIVSASNDVPPVINPNWLADRADQELAVAAYRRAREIVALMAGSFIIGDEVSPGPNVTSDAQILEHIQTRGLAAIHHGSATCAMGKVGAAATVVDSKARVQGVTGLRVIDVSSLPFTPPGHTQGTTYAHAEKLVQDVIDEHKSAPA